MEEMKQPVVAPAAAPVVPGKQVKSNYLIPLVIVFFSIAAFLGVMYLGLLK